MTNRDILWASATAMLFLTGVCDAADLPKCNDRQAFQVISDATKASTKDMYSGLSGRAQLAMNLLTVGKVRRGATDQEFEQAAAEVMRKIDNANATFANARLDADNGVMKTCSVDVTFVNVLTDAPGTFVQRFTIQMTEDNKPYVRLIEE